MQNVKYNLSECYSWLIDNKLSMHPGKTELILFGSKSKLKKIKQFKVNCEGFVTEASTCVKYLGLDLDQTLSGEATVNTIVNKVNSRVKFLYRQAKYLDTKTKLTIASALILSHFDYSIASFMVLWSN